MRLQLGASVLSAASAVDTRPVRARLERFEGANRSYTAAQRKVDAVDAQLRAAKKQLAEHDAVQDDAVIALARLLIHDGQPYKNAFDAFGVPAPGTLTRLPPAEAAEAVHQLVAAIRRGKGVAAATLAAAEAADKAASIVEQALVPVAKLQENLRNARRTRDAVGRGWDTALAGLQRGAKAAVDEGAPELYATLFPAPTRSTTKTKAPAEPVPPTTQPTTTANAA
jgi:hypothetical protein